MQIDRTYTESKSCSLGVIQRQQQQKTGKNTFGSLIFFKSRVRTRHREELI